MARIARGPQGQHTFHILSRGNGRGTVFRNPAEYRDFIELLKKASQRVKVDVYAFALMPNHFHAVVRPHEDNGLSRLMQWWLTSYVRRVHKRNDSSGHLWQGRFKSFPVQDDEHLLTVLRYVLLNPVRAQLSSSPWDWEWTSLRFSELVSPWPVQLPHPLAHWLREQLAPEELEQLRGCVHRRAPFGDPAWTDKLVKAGGLESTVRPVGRPRRQREDSPARGASWPRESEARTFAEAA